MFVLTHIVSIFYGLIVNLFRINECEFIHVYQFTKTVCCIVYMQYFDYESIVGCYVIQKKMSIKRNDDI